MDDRYVVTLDKVSFSYCKNMTSLTLKSLLLDRSKTSKKNVFKNLSLSLKTGRRYALVGDNGIGKSSLALMIMNEIYPDEGSVILNGRALSLFSDSEDLFYGLDVNGFIKVYFSLLWPRLASNEMKNLISETLKFTSLTKAKDNKMSSLSKGMRQKLLLSIYTACPVDLLIIDESLSGVDSSFFPLFKERLATCLGNSGTLLLVDHNKDLLEYFCDDVLYLKDNVISYLGIKELKLHVN